MGEKVQAETIEGCGAGVDFWQHEIYSVGLFGVRDGQRIVAAIDSMDVLRLLTDDIPAVDIVRIVFVTFEVLNIGKCGQWPAGGIERVHGAPYACLSCTAPSTDEHMICGTGTEVGEEDAIAGNGEGVHVVRRTSGTVGYGISCTCA